MTTKFRAQFDGKALIPLEPVDLPTGEILEVEARETRALRRGSRELLLKIMHEPPHVSAEAVAEMERMIEEGKLPPSDENIFGNAD
jgi:predicted DNA-binding antitoxin AbrB/MazE fold protein